MSIAKTTKRSPMQQRSVPHLDSLPRPVYARMEDMRHRANTGAHHHPWIQFSYASKGILRMEAEGTVLIAPPHWGILVPTGKIHAVSNSADTEIRSLYLHPQCIDRSLSECCVIEVSELLRALIRHFSVLPVLYDEQGAQGRLVQVMLDQINAAPRSAMSLPWPRHTQLQELCQLFMNEPLSPLARAATWAERLHVSERTLSRIFSKETQMSLRLWQQRARLIKAIPLLEQGDSVTDTALECGYESTSAFIAAFRNFVGQTPGSLQRQAAARNVSAI